MEMWSRDIDRRQFLRIGAALGLSGAALMAFVEACGGTTGSAEVSPTPIVYPKAQIDGDLEYFNWTEYLNPDLITSFEKHYGVKVNQTNFDNMQGMMAKLNAGIPYDLTFPTGDYVELLVKADQLTPIDHSQLDNWKEVPSYFNDPWYDKKGIHSVPYAMWTTGIAWRTDQVPDSMTGSWGDLWTLAPKYSGKLYLLDDYQEVLGMSLVRLKYDINSGNKDQVNKAVDELLKIKPYVGKFSTDDITNMVSGSAAIHHSWSGDIYQVISQVDKPEIWRYETCMEGVPTGNDTFVIPKNAKHPGTAMKFIDWMLAPENAKANVEYFGYPMVTTDGISAYQKLVSDYPFLGLTLDQAIHGLREIAPTGAKLQLWNQAWTKVKAA
jgi:spermidine/putrescine transport system substrate-binding protein